MVRHIVSWNFKEGFSGSENKANALKIKNGLESLPGKIKGIIELKVYVNLLPSGNKDAVLNSLFESEEALAAYRVHPEHKRVSDFVAAVFTNRACIDYIE